MKKNNLKFIYLYRHGETNLNVKGITMGQLSTIHTEFTDNGYKQIECLKEKIKENKIDVIYSSDYERTINTAKMVNDTNIPFFITKKLRGLNMGKFQGLPMKEFLNSPQIQKSFKDYSIPIPNGESINDLNNRIINFIIDISDNTNYNNIALITHSAVISNLVAKLLGNSYYNFDECIIEYFEGKLYVISYNQYEKQKILRK